MRLAVIALALLLAGCASPPAVVVNTPYVGAHSFLDGRAEDGDFYANSTTEGTNLTISMQIIGEGACAGRPDHPPLIVVKDPAGAVQAQATLPASPAPGATDCGFAPIHKAFPATPGVWTIHFEGQGNVLATLELD